VPAVREFVLLFVLLKILQPGQAPFGTPPDDAVAGRDDWRPILLYWGSWVIASSTRIVVLPLVSLSWIENGGELRATGWSAAPDYVPLPLVAAPMPERGRLVRELSGVHAVPDLRPARPLTSAGSPPGSPSSS
jgi:hypothetical protein